MLKCWKVDFKVKLVEYGIEKSEPNSPSLYDLIYELEQENAKQHFRFWIFFYKSIDPALRRGEACTGA